MHILSLVLGTFAVILLFIPGLNLIFSPMLSAGAIIIGIIARIVGRKKAKEEDRKIAMGGLILGCTGMFLSFMLYGSCYYLGNMWYESGRESRDLEEKKDLKMRVARMEKELEEKMAVMEELLEKKEEEIRKLEAQDSGSDELEESEEYFRKLIEKKVEMKEELRKWEEWLEKMPLLEEIEEPEDFEPSGDYKAGKEPPAAVEAEEKLKPKAPQPIDMKNPFEKAQKKQQAKKKKVHDGKKDLKTPDTFKKKPGKTDKEVKIKELNPYDYF